jgi:hypothetical protein
VRDRGKDRKREGEERKWGKIDKERRGGEKVGKDR